MELRYQLSLGANKKLEENDNSQPRTRKYQRSLKMSLPTSRQAHSQPQDQIRYQSRGRWRRKQVAGTHMRVFLVWLLILPMRAYRLLLSPWIGHSCRFQPSCSVYAIEALETHGPVHGLWLTLRRVARCNPCGGSGYDPVPSVSNRKNEK